MTHLAMDQLLAFRDPGREPALTAAERHLAACSHCQAEVARLDQRIARLRALPVLRPGRSRFDAVQRRLQAERRARAMRWGGIGGLALAASLAGLFFAGAFRPGTTASNTVAAAETRNDLTTLQLRSRQLEEALAALGLDRRPMDGRTALLAARIEDQLGLLDRRLQMAGGGEGAAQQIKLWRERIGLLDALMDVHATNARYAGL